MPERPQLFRFFLVCAVVAALERQCLLVWVPIWEEEVAAEVVAEAVAAVAATLCSARSRCWMQNNIV